MSKRTPKTIRCGPPKDMLFGDAMARAQGNPPNTQLAQGGGVRCQDEILIANLKSDLRRELDRNKILLDEIHKLQEASPSEDNDRVMDLIRAAVDLDGLKMAVSDEGLKRLRRLVDTCKALPPHIIEQARGE